MEPRTPTSPFQESLGQIRINNSSSSSSLRTSLASRLPIHEFLNDQDAGFNCSFPNSVHTSLAVTKSFDDVHLLKKEEDGGALVVPFAQRPVYSHPCIFHFLKCTESFSLFEEWRVYVLSYFWGYATPTEARCPLCSWKVADLTRDRAWNIMLHHVAMEHFQSGHTLATSRPDFALYRFLFNRKILDRPQVKVLFMASATGTYEQPAQSRGASPNETGHAPYNAPFVRTANEGRQRRRGLERRSLESRAPRASSRSRRLGTMVEYGKDKKTQAATSPQRTSHNTCDHQSLNNERFTNKDNDAQAVNSLDLTSQFTRDHPDLEWKAVPPTPSPTRSTQAEAKEYSEGGEGSSTPSILELGLKDVHTPSTETSRKSLEQQIAEMELSPDHSRSDSSVDADSSSKSSSQECRSLMSTAKRRLLIELMDIFHLNYDSILGNRVRAYAYQSSNEKAAESTSSLGPGNEGDGNMKNPDIPGISKPGSKIQRKFACVFYKHDPITYGTNGVTGAKYRACGGPGFGSVSRVKEHLYRRHRAPTQCPRCFVEFNKYEELVVHLNQTVRCEQQLSQQVEGITLQQLEKLKSKKRAYSVQTEEDRWREVYRICFPREIVPIPYYDWDTIDTEVPVLRDIEDLQEYSRRCVPRVVESRFEAMILEKLQPIRDEIIGALGDILESSISAVFEEWQQKRQRQSPDPDVGGQDSAPHETLILPLEPLTDIQRQRSDNFDEFLEMPSTSFDRSVVGLGETSDLFNIFGDYIPAYASQEQNRQPAPSAGGESAAGQYYEAQDATSTQGNPNFLDRWDGEETNLDLSQWQPDATIFLSGIPDSNSIPDYSEDIY